jgi:hypothetical protein
MKNNLERLLEILTRQADLIDRLTTRTDLRYKSAYRLVLEYGKPFNNRIVPSPFRGQRQVCYKNCFDALWKRGDYHYCEGYAIDDELDLAIAHAWLINDAREVVDPTWADDACGATYFGVVFDSEYVFEVGKITKNYGILETNYPNWRKLMVEGLPQNALQQTFYQNVADRI